MKRATAQRSETSSNFKKFAFLCVAMLASLTSINAIAENEAIDPLVISPTPIERPQPQPVQQPIHRDVIRTAPMTPPNGAYSDDLSPISTPVARKISSMGKDLEKIEVRTEKLSEYLLRLQDEDKANIDEYYAHISKILAKLQGGTTPSNPRLVKRLEQAENKLDDLSKTITAYNRISRQAGDTAAQALVLSQDAAATFDLPGAVEQDHVDLSMLQDNIARSIVSIERIGHTVTGDITRASRYERAERTNLRALSLAVEKGDLYGVGPVGTLGVAEYAAQTPARQDIGVAERSIDGSSEWKPLIKVTFNKPNVDYEAPLYASVHEALLRQPDAQFEIVSVYPAAQFGDKGALAPSRSAELDRNASKMRDVMTNMGLPAERVRTSSRWGKSQFGEIYVYLTK